MGYILTKTITIDPACWPERWKLPHQRIDAENCLLHRFEPPFLFGIYLKNLQRNRAAPLRPIALQRSSQWRYHQILREQEPCKSSLTVSYITRKRKECKLNVRTSESLLRTLIYLAVFSLLAVTDLDTWLASSRTRAIIWSLLDLALLLLSFWLSYLCMVLPSA